MSPKERSANIFRQVAPFVSEQGVTFVLRALDLEIEESHTALESQTDLRIIHQIQGRIQLARSIKKLITEPTATVVRKERQQ